jgi:tRNA(Arg) A34 adenosine deaminase TadA
VINPDNMDDDKNFLIRAVTLAADGIQKGGGPFGAVITKNGQVMAEAYNKVVILKDPTAHAEILAIRQASQKIGSHDLSDCTLYTSCEPCPMCLGAIYWAGIKKVFYAANRKDAANAGFSDEYIYDEIELIPEQRKIIFNHLPEIDGQKVFQIWDLYENKNPY